ncbi:hypothetical protein Tco_0045407 [Tanacetum coccineum]
MRILLDIEQLTRSFLWRQGSMRNGKAMVAWNVVVLPTDEGCLGIRMCGLSLIMPNVGSELESALQRNLSLLDGGILLLWYSLSPLADVVSPRDRSRSGLNSTSMVAYIMGSGLLEWPPDLGMKYPSLLAIPSPRLYQGIPDKLEWRTSLGVVKPFAISLVWQSIRPRGFKTDCGVGTWLVLCQAVVRFVRPLRTLMSISSLSALSLLRCTSKSVISKLVLVVAAYFMWKERNESLFKGLKRSSAQVIECVVSAVRLKLMSCRFKKNHCRIGHMSVCVLSQFNRSYKPGKDYNHNG